MMTWPTAVGGLVAFVNLPAGATGTTTVSSATQFTRGLRQGRATATAGPCMWAAPPSWSRPMCGTTTIGGWPG